MNNYYHIVAIILIAVLFFVLGPILSIYAVNQLFGTNIAFTFWNWVCVAWLHIAVASTNKG
jgi:hypothetical protein